MRGLSDATSASVFQMRTVVESLVARLGAKRCGRGWLARCPAHDDRKPSLSIREGAEGRILLKCHAGCNTNDVLATLGLAPRDLFAESAKMNRSPMKLFSRESKLVSTQLADEF